MSTIVFLKRNDKGSH